MGPSALKSDYGERLHREVPPERWCVSYGDLVQFRADVVRAIQDGTIEPTERDPFNVADTSHGPCVHTVNWQFITPITARAGSVSWALMLHPQGLKCDLFVTHAWQEGIFEFIDKCLNSWPPGAKGAYCCMLSNPQNLDISDLIATPRSSPFAKALMSARFMLVISTSTGSIYTRAWCTYEAFLAYTWGKFIFTASAPNKFLHFVMAGVLVSVLLSAGVGALMTCDMSSPRVQEFANEIADHYCSLCLQVCLLLCITLCDPCHVRAVGLLGASSVGFRSGWISVRIARIWEHVPLAALALEIIQTLFYIAAFMGSEGDRVYAEQAKCEAKELRAGYTGRVRDAQCSVPADGKRILAELVESGEENEVDAAVSVLIRAGMSTPSLREAAHFGAHLCGAGYSKYAMMLFAVGDWFMCPLNYILKPRDWAPPVAIAWFIIVQVLIWVALNLVLSRDCRLFSYAAAGRVIIIGRFIPSVLMPFFISDDADHAVSRLLQTRSTYFLCFVLGPGVIALSAAGPGKIARIPFAGPILVRLVATDWCKSEEPSHAVALLKEIELPATSPKLQSSNPPLA